MTVRFVIIALLVSTATAGPGAGQQPDVWDDVSNYKGWPVAKLEITGVEKGLAKELKKGLDLAGESVLYESRVREDLERIRLFLARRGHPYAGVRPVVEADLVKREIELTFEVDPGPAVIIESYHLGNVPDAVRPQAERALVLRPGDVFSDDAIETDIQAVIQELEKSGHARARAAATFEWIDTTNVAIRIVAIPGPVFYFRKAVVSGVSDDLALLAYTMVDIRRGERYEPRTLVDARNFLSRTGLYRQIRLTLEDAAPDSLDLIVELQEQKPRSIETAVGYWSDEKFTGRVRWQHRNIFSKGRGMSFEIVYNQFRQWGEWATWWPAFLGMKKSLATLRLGINSESEVSYDLLAPTASVAYGYNFTRRFTASIAAAMSRASYDIKTDEREFFENPEGAVGWLEAWITRDATDDRISPSSGTFSWMRLQWGPPGGISEANWFSAEGNGTYMVPIKATVLAVNARLGYGLPIEPAVVLLPDRRFYAGGPVSHRGFNRRMLGPKDSGDLPLGGEVMATGFVEYRFPIVWKFNGAVFADWGQVWQYRGEATFDNIEIAIGPALRIMTPVGPLRFDWGYRLTDYDTSQPRSVFHFAIGYMM
jgi:outer membrane protein insertion porin family